MLNKINGIAALISAVLLFPEQGVPAKTAGTKDGGSVGTTKAIVSELWIAPTDISSRNLFYGPGGEKHQPGKSLTFIKEDLSGSNPKFDVRDENGVCWKVKLGVESQPETVASRLLWAVGYYADEDYYRDSAQMRNLPAHLHRGQNFVEAGGTIHSLRLKREDKGYKRTGFWRWRNGPFSGTRELNGLRVMMALINNWDLKDENNATLEEPTGRVYEVSDLGASFGSSGVLLEKKAAKGNLHSYQRSKFMTKAGLEYVDFSTPSLPSLPYIFNPWQYGRRARLHWIGRHINRSDAQWMGQLLGQLSRDQIRDAFRAAGYSPTDAAAFTQTLQTRIEQLKGL
jgi:hypothetical protein